MPVATERLIEPAAYQTDRINKNELGASPRALDFAYSLDVLRSAKISPKPDLSVDATDIEYHKTEYGGGAVLEYKADPDSPGMGLVLVPEIELKSIEDRTGHIRYIRLESTSTGEPRLMQMGPRAMEVALASRAAEYLEMHSEETHSHIRSLINGEIPHVPRSNTRSPVLEEALGMVVGKKKNGYPDVIAGATRVITTKELAYKRQFAKGRILSRTEAAKGTLMLGPDGVVSSLYALGGMPPVTGSVDSVVAAAMSHMRSWIPRNGIFAGNFQKQLDVFEAAKKRIQSYGLPSDIETNTIAQIGIAVGCENPKEIAQQVARFQVAGGHAARIYSTNPDHRVVDTGEEIYREVGDNFLTAVGPVVDINQARELRREANVREFLPGHGGGENCTSLDGGGAANSIEILYEMSIDPMFNDCLIGLEGGTGNNIGGILSMVDVVSMNRRGAGGIESTEGLFGVKDGIPVLPYHGSASAVTKLIEYYARLGADPVSAARILGLDGRIRHIEGKPNYMQMRDSARSIVTRFAEAREVAGRVLADQQSSSIYELRQRVAQQGSHNHVLPSRFSVEIAGEHR